MVAKASKPRKTAKPLVARAKIGKAEAFSSGEAIEAAGQRVAKVTGPSSGDALGVLDKGTAKTIREQLATLSATQTVVFNRTMASFTLKHVQTHPLEALDGAFKAAIKLPKTLPAHLEPTKEQALRTYIEHLPPAMQKSFIEYHAKLSEADKRALERYLAFSRALGQPTEPVAIRTVNDAASWSVGTILLRAIGVLVSSLIAAYLPRVVELAGPFAGWYLHNKGWIADEWAIYLGFHPVNLAFKAAGTVAKEAAETIGYLSLFWAAVPETVRAGLTALPSTAGSFVVGALTFLGRRLARGPRGS